MSVRDETFPIPRNTPTLTPNLLLRVCAQSLSRVRLCDPVDCSSPGSSSHGVFQARKLEWVAISFSRGSSQCRDWHLFLKKGVFKSKHTDNLDILLNFNYVGVNLKKEIQHILVLAAPPTHTIFWPPVAKSWLIWKDPNVGKDLRQEGKGTIEGEMIRWHHWLNGHEFG